MSDLCNKQPHCESPGWRKNCPGACPDDKPEEEATTKAPSEAKKATTKASATTKKAAKKSCNKRSPCIPMAEANANFLKRCQASPLGASCHQHCRYDEDMPTMKAAFTSSKHCKINELRTFLIAASNGKNNEACCADTGILAQKKTGVCGCFCNPAGPVWPGKNEAVKYIPCVSILRGIMDCHYFAEGAD